MLQQYTTNVCTPNTHLENVMKNSGQHYAPTHSHTNRRMMMRGRCLNEWHMAYETDKAQPPVDVPFDMRGGLADKFLGQWQLPLKDGRRQSKQSV